MRVLDNTIRRAGRHPSTTFFMRRAGVSTVFLREILSALQTVAMVTAALSAWTTNVNKLVYTFTWRTTSQEK